ncbi:MAG: hypothetical protein IJF92_05785 [Bacilli bacterium]|nr:hypothetical protein [Bacilli bacterium]
MKNKIGIILFIVFVYFMCILDVEASNNLLVGNEKWRGYFSGNNKLDKWTGAKGKLKSDSINSFSIDMSSVGHWVEGDPSWQFGAQAQLKDKSINLKIGEKYRYRATIKSDKDRRIFIKIAEVEMNTVKQNYEDIDNLLLEKWIHLKENTPYHFDETFISTSNVKRVSFYYAVGWNHARDCEQNSPNKIKVSNISVSRTNKNKKIKYKKITGIKNYSYGVVAGKTSVKSKKIKKKKNNIKLVIDRSLKYVTSIKVNNEEITYKKSGKTILIPVNKFKNEFNSINIYSKTLLQQKKFILSRVIIKNSKITKYKTKKINLISKYKNKNKNSNINLLIKRTKRDINTSNTKDDIDKVFDEFKIDYDIQKLIESKKKIKNNKKNINKDNKYIYKLEFIVGLILFVSGIILLIMAIKTRLFKEREIEII